MTTTRAVARRRETRRDFGCRLLEVRKETVVGVGECVVRVVGGDIVWDGRAMGKGQSEGSGGMGARGWDLAGF